MQVTTIRLEENTLDDLEDDADAHGFRNRTEYIRWLIDERERIHENTTSSSEDPETVEQLRERVDDLEDTVADLVEDRPERDAGEREGRRDAPDATTSTETPPPASAGDSRPLSEDDVEETIEDALKGWRPGRTPEGRKKRRAIGRRVLEWLQTDGGPASAGNFKAALYEETHLEGQGKDAWWRKTARPAVQRAVDAGLAKYREGHHDYQWIGAEGVNSST